MKQKHEDGTEHPISFHSRSLHTYEKNYTITELECLAIIDSISKWHCYLHGIHFTIVSDHAGLQWLKKIKNPTGRLFRWSLRLSTYDYQIKYQKGSIHYEADALSRVNYDDDVPLPRCTSQPYSTNLLTHEELLTRQDEIKQSSKNENLNNLYIIQKRGFKKTRCPIFSKTNLIE